MGSDWYWTTLDELVDFQAKRPIRKGAIVPFIAMADISENQKYIVNIEDREYKGGGSRFTNGDTLFARITPCLENGKTALVTKLEENTIAHGSTEFIVMSPRDLEADKEFVYYLARLPEFRRFAESRMEGTSGRQRVSWQSLSGYPLNCPPSAERKDIGNFLASLDDKIELNRQMNATLEAIAQALFKSWFVDFDPVIDNAIAANNPIPEPFQARAAARRALGDKRKPLPPEIQKQFPSSFTFNEDLGWIPEVWEIWSFGKVSTCFDSKRIPLSKKQREEKKPGTIPYYGATSVVDYIDEWIFDDIFLLVGEDGSVIKEDQTPFIQYIWGKTWVNNHAHVLQGAAGISTEHLLLFISRQNVSAYVTGAVQPKINQKNLNSIPFLNAGENLNKDFTSLISPYFNKKRVLLEENETLTSLRDTLLPKLLSGQIRIPDAEAVVAEAI